MTALVYEHLSNVRFDKRNTLMQWTIALELSLASSKESIAIPLIIHPSMFVIP